MRNILKTRAVFSHAGFTLVELIITLLISMIIVGSIYTAFISQQHTYIVQEQVAEMQQNIRAALMLMGRDIRMAGYSPEGGSFGFVNGDFNGTLVTTDSTNIAFTVDLDEDGTLDTTCEDTDGSGTIDMTDMEQIAYRLNGADLERYSTTTGAVKWSDIAEGIEQIEFRYLDSAGVDLGDATGTIPSGSLNDIRSVQISILARAGQPDRKFNNATIYCPASHPIKNLTTTPPQCEDSAGATLASATWGPYNDNYRRRLLITTVLCRNMGL